MDAVAPLRCPRGGRERHLGYPAGLAPEEPPLPRPHCPGLREGLHWSFDGFLGFWLLSGHQQQQQTLQLVGTSPKAAAALREGSHEAVAPRPAGVATAAGVGSVLLKMRCSREWEHKGKATAR